MGRGGLAALAVGALLLPAPPPARPRLIQFGWDEPDTAYLRAHAVRMQASPFDGCVFHATYRTADGATGNLAWQAWGPRAFTERDVAAARADLRALAPGRFRANLLRVNVTPGTVDVFDDFTPVLANLRLAASLARAGGGPGLLLDTEQYEAPVWDYHRLPHAGTRTFADYAAQMRRRGAEAMGAIQEGYPGARLMVTFGHSLVFRQSGGGHLPLSECSYGLLAAFLDGVADVAPRGALVDGHELSYGWREPYRFADARSLIHRGVLPIAARPDRYRHAISAGFGIWLDYDWRTNGWDPDEPAGNHFPPATLEAVVTAALRAADDFVWIYTEKPRFWTASGVPEGVPAAYDHALRRARSAGGRERRYDPEIAREGARR